MLPVRAYVEAACAWLAAMCAWALAVWAVREAWRCLDFVAFLAGW
jgi:hypothetical protein